MPRFLLSILLAVPVTTLELHDPRQLAEAAVERHPSMARIRAEAAAALEQVAPAGALPNPMLMGGIQNKEIDLSDDEMMTMYMVGASQRILRPAVRNARSSAARLRSESIAREAASLQAEIERDVYLAWYDVAASDGALRTMQEVRETIHAVVAAARVRYEVGSAVQADVIRAQLQLSELEQEILRARAARREAALRLLTLVDLPFDTPVPTLVLPQGTDDLAIDAPASLRGSHPAIEALQLEAAALEEEIRIAELRARPDVEVEASYGYRPTQRDMFSVVAKVELPLRRDRTIEPRIREAMLRRDAVRTRIAELNRELAIALAAAVVAHEEATQQLDLYDQVLVPQARLAFDSTLAAYQSGRASFDSILTTETAYVRLSLQRIEFLARHAQAVVAYEAIQRGARSAAVSLTRPAPSAAGNSSGAPMNGM